MGQKDLQLQGYPRSHLKKDWSLFEYCGGSGAGGCAVLLNNSQVQYAIEVNPFITLNRLLTLQNTGAFEVATDGGPGGICSHTIGTMQSCYIAFSATSATLTPSQILAQNNAFTPQIDQILEFTMAKLPQPTDPGWAGKFYITLYWGQAGSYWGNTDYANDIQYFTPVKHDFDQRQ